MSSKYKVERSDVILFVIAMIFSFVYVVFSYSASKNINLVSDTLQYYYAFESIESFPFPYYLEVVTPLYMSFVSFIGLPFEFFIFLCYLTWLPVILWFVFQSKKYPVIILVPLFFLSHFFYENSAFLIRQYLGCSFFFIFIYLSLRKNSLCYIPLLLSVFCHLSFLFYFLLYVSIKSIVNKRGFIVRYIPYAFVPIISLSVFSGVDGSDVIVSLIRASTDIVNIDSLTRKVLYYRTDNLDSTVNVTVFSLILLEFYILSVVLSFCKDFDRNLISVILLFYVSMFLFLILRNTVVLSNRVGFLSFYFAIPLFPILCSFFSFNLSRFSIKMKI